jgi:hypothetical protein
MAKGEHHLFVIYALKSDKNERKTQKSFFGL